MKLGRGVSTDVLIVGGGIGGLAAAISAKERSPEADVLIVEKNTSGWAGVANKGHGHFWFLAPGQGVEAFLDFHVRNIGIFLEDQDLLGEFARESLPTLERFDSWGAKLCRGEGGAFVRESIKPGLPWSMTIADLDMLSPVHRRATDLGIKFIDKVAMVDLLKDGDRVAGAIGFSLLDGTCHIVNAKAVILATGGQSFGILDMWKSMRGDGHAAAYRAGAEMRSAEFGSSVEFVDARSKRPIEGAEEALYNRLGENLSRAFQQRLEPALSAEQVVLWYQEMKAGRGPIMTHHDENPVSGGAAGKPGRAASGQVPGEGSSDLLCPRPRFEAFRERLVLKAGVVEGNSRVAVVLPAVSAELSPVRVDYRMATSVPGLFAIGNVSHTGSALVGAVPASPGRMHGSGLTGAIWMGIRAGAAAVPWASEAPDAAVDGDQAESLKEAICAPYGRATGVLPQELVRAVQAAMSPIGYSVYKSKERMEEALALVLDAKRRIPGLVASDPHHLSACNEAKSTILCAEMFYRSSLAREESRGWHIREDYPERDDQNWLKWVIIKDVAGSMTVSTEDVPIARYPIRP